MLKILGRNTSINVMKVLWTCAELDLPFERADIGGPFGGNDKPEYRSMNPNGLVPTIDDDGFILWESNSIVRYLAAKHDAGGLSPGDLRVRADAERWMDWQLTVLGKGITPVFWQLIRTPAEKRDPAVIEQGRKDAIAAMNILESVLSRQPFLAGNRLTIGDVPVGCMVYRWLALPVDRPSMPAVEAYHARLSERPGYREHVMLPLV